MASSFSPQGDYDEIAGTQQVIPLAFAAPQSSDTLVSPNANVLDSDASNTSTALRFKSGGGVEAPKVGGGGGGGGGGGAFSSASSPDLTAANVATIRGPLAWRRIQLRLGFLMTIVAGAVLMWGNYERSHSPYLQQQRQQQQQQAFTYFQSHQQQESQAYDSLGTHSTASSASSFALFPSSLSPVIPERTALSHRLRIHRRQSDDEKDPHANIVVASEEEPPEQGKQSAADPFIHGSFLTSPLCQNLKTASKPSSLASSSDICRNKLAQYEESIRSSLTHYSGAESEIYIVNLLESIMKIKDEEKADRRVSLMVSILGSVSERANMDTASFLHSDSNQQHRIDNEVLWRAALSAASGPASGSTTSFARGHSSTVPTSTPTTTSASSSSRFWNASVLTPSLKHTSARSIGEGKDGTPILMMSREHSRISWMFECLAASRASEGQLPTVTTLETTNVGYYGLKKQAFQIFAATRNLWDSTATTASTSTSGSTTAAVDTRFPRALPQADDGFYNGPRIEDWWRYTFGKPVRKLISLAEFHYETQHHDIPNIDVVMENTVESSAPSPSSSSPSSLQVQGAVWEKAYHAAMLALRAAEGKTRPVDALDIATTAGVPLVYVQEPFEFDLFYPFVPLFVPWERMSLAVYYEKQEDVSYVDAIEEYLVQKVNERTLYVSVVQRAAGIRIKNPEMARVARNTLCFNAGGGGGDIPIPLLAGEKPLLLLPSNTKTSQASRQSRADDDSGNGGKLNTGKGKISLDVKKEDLSHWISFMGTMRGAVRIELDEIMRRHPAITMGSVFSSPTSSSGRYYSGFIASNTTGTGVGRASNSDSSSSSSSSSALSSSANTATTTTTMTATSSASSPFPNEWMQVMANSMLQLAPRGINPTSFRLYETLQMGLIPIYVWGNEDGSTGHHHTSYARPWLPYLPSHVGNGVTVENSTSSNGGSIGKYGMWDRIAFVLNANEEFEAFLDALPELVARATTTTISSLTQTITTTASSSNTKSSRSGSDSNTNWYQGMKHAIEATREDFFTYEGVIGQIYKLLLNPQDAALRCSAPAQQLWLF